MQLKKREFETFLRQDFLAFAEASFSKLHPGIEYLPSWHIEIIGATLEKSFRGELRRLIINVPPRSLKSHLGSVCFPAWILGRRPHAQIVCISYAQDLSNRWASLCRSIMSTDWYQRVFPDTRLGTSRQLLHDLTTTQNGFRLATSIGGVLTGRGGDFIIIDDPLKPEEAYSETQRKSVNDWYDHSLLTRLDDKRTGCIIVIMQRLHEDDLVGHVLKHGDWTVLKFPAIAEEDERHIVDMPYRRRVFVRKQGEALHPEREPREILDDLRKQMGEPDFAAQYQQDPVPAGGLLIKTEWFKVFNLDECPKGFDLVFQSWDTANKSSKPNNFSVGTTWGVLNKHLYLLDVFRKRLDYPDLRRTVKQLAETYGAKNILIEDQASGIQLIQDLIADGVHAVTRYKPKMNKEARLNSVVSMIGNGFVHIPDQAPWRADFLREVMTFPKGRFDDQVDSLSQALDWFKEFTPKRRLFEVIRVPTKHVPFASHSSALQQPRSISGFRHGGW